MPIHPGELRAILKFIEDVHGSGCLLVREVFAWGKGWNYVIRTPRGRSLNGTVEFEVLGDVFRKHGWNAEGTALIEDRLREDNLAEHNREVAKLECERVNRDYHDSLDWLTRSRDD